MDTKNRRKRTRGLSSLLVCFLVLGLAAGTAYATQHHAGHETPPSLAFLVREDNPVDAFGASAVAGRMGAPVLLSNQTTLSEEARRGLMEADPDIVIIAGGVAALAPEIEEQVAAALPSAEVRRVGGATRIHTAENMAKLIGEFAPAWLPAAAAEGFVAAHPELAQVNLATAAYQDVEAANEDGWDILFTPDETDPNSACFDHPDLGGMGVHYVNGDLLDGALDATQPEALVYEVTPDGLKLVAVEYVVPDAAWDADQPPSVLGRDLHFNEALGLWALHAWIWKDNPAGMFADFNPKVRPCPDELDL
jgi:hypothetical protein